MNQTAQETSELKSGQIEANRQLYGIKRWGREYFDISDQGNVVFKLGANSRSFELLEIIEGLRARGLEMPVLLRLENLIDSRIALLNHAFREAIQTAGYQNEYRGVYPIKVNQQHHVVERVAAAGRRFGHGMEAGSKGELLIAMSCVQSRDSLIICNGYKDTEFVDLGLQANRLGYQCFFVIETLHELELILERAAHWNIDPLLGIRLKLSTKVDGHWHGDSGDFSLFGLSTRQLVKVIDQLKKADKLACLQLLHFHQGSQIPNIRNIRDGVNEACRYYVELVREGAPLAYFNLGGGLAIDYDGLGTSEANSRNYSLEEYCIDIVEGIMESLDPNQVAHPVIVSESGRWTVAPMSILLFNVISVSHFDPEPLPPRMPTDVCEPVLNLVYTLNHVEPRRVQECYNDVVYYRDQMRNAFRNGEIGLRERALGENIALTIIRKIVELIPEVRRPPDSLLEIQRKLSDIYYGNFSVFQSLPDAWAINQVFPVMPLHRLDEAPDRSAIIADLTCDCDGKLHRFVGPDDVEPTLRLHQTREGEDYFLGVFLTGAYQETLGDLHNLFGDTNVASVRIDQDGKVQFVHELQGDSIADVLSYVEYQPQELYQKFRKIAEHAVQNGQVTVAQRQAMLELFSESLRGYTYFENP